jgi:hypothetical protein
MTSAATATSRRPAIWSSQERVNLSDLALLVRGFSSEPIAGAMQARASIAASGNSVAPQTGWLSRAGLRQNPQALALAVSAGIGATPRS